MKKKWDIGLAAVLKPCGAGLVCMALAWSAYADWTVDRGKTVFVFNPGEHYALGTRDVVVKEWQGRAVRVGQDPMGVGARHVPTLVRGRLEPA